MIRGAQWESRPVMGGPISAQESKAGFARFLPRCNFLLRLGCWSASTSVPEPERERERAQPVLITCTHFANQCRCKKPSSKILNSTINDHEAARKDIDIVATNYRHTHTYIHMLSCRLCPQFCKIKFFKIKFCFAIWATQPTWASSESLKSLNWEPPVQFGYKTVQLPNCAIWVIMRPCHASTTFPSRHCSPSSFYLGISTASLAKKRPHASLCCGRPTVCKLIKIFSAQKMRVGRLRAFREGRKLEVVGEVGRTLWWWRPLW